MTTTKSPIPMLIVLYGSAFVAACNENTINVALVSIMDTFALDANTAQWLVTGYMIVTAIVVTITAFLMKRLRLRTLFLLAASLLIVGLIATMFAPIWPLFLAARLMQAIGTGIFIPVMMSTVLALAPRTKLGTYLSIGGCMITFGPAFAPFVSGIMVTTFGWRTIFLPPAIIMGILVVAGIALIRNIAEPEPLKLDLPSVGLSSAGLFLFVYGLSLVMARPLIALIIGAMGLIALGLFARRQMRIPNSLLNLNPLRNKRFAPVCVLVVVAMMTTFSMSVLLPLYFEGSLGTTAFMAGALLLAPILVNALTSLVGGRVMGKRGCWPLLPLGFGIIAMGQLGVCLFSPALSLVGVLIASIVVYAGVGLVLSPSQTAGLQTLRPEENPHGVAIINTFIQVAASIGPSLFIGILSSVSGNAVAAGMSSALANAQGFSASVAVATVIAVVGAFVALVYARKRAVEAATESQVAAAAQTTPATEPAGVVQAATHPLARDPETLTAADLMKAPYVVSSQATVRAVMEELIARKTSGLPVVDEAGGIVGFVTDGDLMAAFATQQTQGFDLAATLAVVRDFRDFDERFAETLNANVMELATQTVVSVTPQTALDELCRLLSTKRIKKVPVLEAAQVVGTVSRGDIVRVLMAHVVAR